MSATAENLFLGDLPEPARPTTQAAVSDSPGTAAGLLPIQGRLGVLSYNARVVGVLALMLIGFAAIFGIGSSKLEEAQIGLRIGASALVLALVLALVVLFARCVTLMIRRLHDIELSGWYALLLVVPVVGTVFHLYAALAPGSQETNRYGTAGQASALEKVFGILGIGAMILSAVAIVMQWH